jgi:sec-independent protein translocase protein TatB
MPDFFSWSHILIVLVVALVVVGPKDLPRLMNMAGRWAGKARGMANEFKKSFDDMARQEELDKLRTELEELRDKHIVPAMPDMNVDVGGAAPAEAVPEPRSGEFQINSDHETGAPVAEPAGGIAPPHP